MTIPKADGNAASRIYGFNVEVIGKDIPLRKSVYASGYNRGLGFEPNGGVTTFRIDKRELPGGGKLVFRVWPCSSLGTRGEPISKSAECIRVAVEKTVANLNRDAKFVITDGANMPDNSGVLAEKWFPWIKSVFVEEGEIVVYTRKADEGATLRVK